jgi:hypothetical protein
MTSSNLTPEQQKLLDLTVAGIETVRKALNPKVTLNIKTITNQTVERRRLLADG